MYAQLKSTDDAQVGDTIHLERSPVEPLAGFKPAVPMVGSKVSCMHQPLYTIKC